MTCSILVSVLLENRLDKVLLTLYGFIISWTYLRFVKEQNGVRGDRSEEFSFVSFFPEILKYSIIRAVT